MGGRGGECLLRKHVAGDGHRGHVSRVGTVSAVNCPECGQYVEATSPPLPSMCGRFLYPCKHLSTGDYGGLTPVRQELRWFDEWLYAIGYKEQL